MYVAFRLGAKLTILGQTNGVARVKIYIVVLVLDLQMNLFADRPPADN